VSAHARSAKPRRDHPAAPLGDHPPEPLEDHPPDVDRFLEAFGRFSRAIRRARGARPRMNGDALTLSQYGLLEPLLDQPEARSSELAEAAGITASTATRILDALERNGIVHRGRSKTDRRAVAVSLTPEGRSVLAAWRRWVQERELALYETFEPEHRAIAEELLRRLTRFAEELGAGPPSDAA
jgi:DNA-binding MarR family transcriptional regulator